MKKGIKRGLYIIVTLIIVLVPIFTNASLAHAKEKYDKHDKRGKYYPSISLDTKTLDYSGETFELSLSNEKNVKKITWYSQDERVAKVVANKDNSSAMVTSVGKGTTWINCKIVLKQGWSYNLGATVTVKSNEVKKPDVVNVTQAKLLSIVRADNYTITATFDKSIEIPGLILLNNKTVCIEGVIDSKDATKVNYSIPSDTSGLTGKQKIYIGYYSSLGVVVSKNTISKLAEVVVDFTSNITTALPAPAAILQDPNNNSVISIIFNQNLDKVTAETVSNYIIDKVSITSAELNNTTSGAIVKLKIKAGSITQTKDYSVLVYGLKGLNNSYTTMNAYQNIIYLKDNVAPLVKSYNYVYPTSIVIQFDEKVMGTANFKVLQNNKNILSHAVISGDTITLVLLSTPESNNYLEIIPLQDIKITDLYGNVTTSSLSKYIVPTIK